jgi:hypothetical protein
MQSSQSFPLIYVPVGVPVEKRRGVCDAEYKLNQAL